MKIRVFVGSKGKASLPICIGSVFEVHIHGVGYVPRLLHNITLPIIQHHLQNPPGNTCGRFLVKSI